MPNPRATASAKRLGNRRQERGLPDAWPSADGEPLVPSEAREAMFWYSASPNPPVLAMTQILHCLKKHGQRLDSELAKETGVPIAKVRQHLAELAATGAIITCNLTTFEQGKRIEALVCRMSGWVPPPAPGRKTKQPA